MDYHLIYEFMVRFNIHSIFCILISIDVLLISVH